MLTEYYTTHDEEDTNRAKKRNVLQERPANLAMPPPAGRNRAESTDDDPESSSVSNTSENGLPKLTAAEKRVQKKAAKDQKAQSKAAKNQLKHNVSVKQEDIDNVKNVLHGDQEDETSGSGHPLATDKSIEDVIARNRSFVANIREHRKDLLRAIGGRRKSDKERRRLRKRASDQNGQINSITAEDEETEELVNAILVKLGVAVQVVESKSSTTTPTTSPKAATFADKARVDITEKLRAAIKDDLEKHENEQRQTCIRAGGFWRYVGRSCFERMTEIAERIDWRTGEIRKDESLDE